MASHTRGVQTTVTATDLLHLRYNTYVDVVAFTILIYDYLITFEAEKRLIWPMPSRSLAKTLFLVTRYMPFIDTSIAIWYRFQKEMTIEDCKVADNIMGWMIFLGIVVAEGILSLRTWAVWGQSRKIAIGLAVWSVMNVSANIVVIAIFMDSLRFSTVPDHFSGCLEVSGNPIFFLDWLLLLLFDGGLLTLMLIKGVQQYRELGNSALYKAVFGDGIIVYIYLFTLSIANIVMNVTLPRDLATILTSFERVIHSVLAGRILLTLRGLSKHPGGDNYTEDGTELRSAMVFGERQAGRSMTSTGLTNCGGESGV